MLYLQRDARSMQVTVYVCKCVCVCVEQEWAHMKLSFLILVLWVVTDIWIEKNLVLVKMFILLAIQIVQVN